MAKVEVERKYRVKRKHLDRVVARLFKWLFTATPMLQEDRYLLSARGVTERVRREEVSGEVVCLLTRKRKVREKNSPNTNLEEEEKISVRRHAGLVSRRQASAFDCPLIVRKTPRIDFRGNFEGVAVSVCLDRIEGPDGHDYGWFVELETMVDDVLAVQGAHRVLKHLRDELLPKAARRERRGYRTMVLDELRKQSKEGKKNKKG